MLIVSMSTMTAVSQEVFPETAHIHASASNDREMDGE